MNAKNWMPQVQNTNTREWRRSLDSVLTLLPQTHHYNSIECRALAISPRKYSETASFRRRFVYIHKYRSLIKIAAYAERERRLQIAESRMYIVRGKVYSDGQKFPIFRNISRNVDISPLNRIDKSNKKRSETLFRNA